MILITGATGTIGGEIARQLAATGERVRAMARDPARADVPVGTEVVRADFDDASSLEHAVDGASAVFLATAPGPAVPRHDAAMLAAARAAGVAKIVKLSAIGTTVAGEPDGPDGRGQVKVGAWHRPGEEAIRARKRSGRAAPPGRCCDPPITPPIRCAGRRRSALGHPSRT